MQGTATVLTSDIDADEYRRTFGQDYADYVEVIEPLLADTHQYWQGEGAACGEAYRGDAVSGREACELMFGSSAEGRRQRDFRVIRAFDDELLVEPRQYGSEKERTAIIELLGCCFPDATWFVPRASHQWVYREANTLSHNIETGPSGECRRSTDPSKDPRGFRVFEVSCAGDECGSIGSPEEDVVPACVLESSSSQALTALTSPCVYDGLTAQLAVYAGQEPSVRNMEFSWVLSGGFTPFVIPMTSFGDRKQSNPQRLRFVPQVGRLAVTDGGPPSGRDNRPLAFVLLGFENAAGGSDITHSSVNYYYY
jgi:hypothetical protein